MKKRLAPAQFSGAGNPAVELEEPLIQSSPAVSVTEVNWRGWVGCYRLANAVMEAIVVPAIGRVMDLRRIGDDEGTFWQNRSLDGRLPSSFGPWLNYGGDKCWPAPQSDWPRRQVHDWPPAAAFDASSYDAVASNSSLTMTSPVDPHWGIQAVRVFEPNPLLPILRIRTTYRKVRGDAVRVAIWTITQLQEPELLALRMPENSIFEAGYVRLLEAEPAGLRTDGRLLSFRRHLREFVKIGSDASSVLWVGSRSVVKIEAEAAIGDYPDGGCCVEVYTNPGQLEYVELETLGPLGTLEPGATVEHTTSYTVLPRTHVDPHAEAKSALDF